jgi:hypothetical protein
MGARGRRWIRRAAHRDAPPRSVDDWLESAPFYDAIYLTRARERFEQSRERASPTTKPSTATVPMRQALEYFGSLAATGTTGPCPPALAPGPRPGPTDIWELVTGEVPGGHDEVLRLQRYSVAGAREWYAGSIYRTGSGGVCVLWSWYDTDTFVD